MFTEHQLREAADARRAALGGGQSLRSATSALVVPGGAARSQTFPAQMRAQEVKVDGKTFVEVSGCASAYERGYAMWDGFGPYTEVVALGAGAKTLAASPDVSFLVNHKGLTMARTANGTLTLAEDEAGLQSVARLNPKRTDCADLIEAIRDGDVTEMSFAFRIVEGTWSPDYTEYRITEYNIDRGDVSAVNYGANPHTSIEARSAEFLSLLQTVDGPAARAAYEVLGARLGVPAQRTAPEATPEAPAAVSGPSVAFLRAQLEVGRA